jgi:ABC-type glutathione transport system ATPase component
MKRMYEYGEWLKKENILSNDFNFQDLPAVCLIDEIDTYLHPDWQYSILKGLVNAFKNVQFFITSHSPFVLTSIPTSDMLIYELEYVKNTEGGEIIARELMENLYGADANRSTKAISDERLFDVKNLLLEIDTLIEKNDLVEAEKQLNFLKIDKSDISYILAKRKLQLKRLSSNTNGK